MNIELTDDVDVYTGPSGVVMREREVAGEGVLVGELRILANTLQAPRCVVSTVKMFIR